MDEYIKVDPFCRSKLENGGSLFPIRNNMNNTQIPSVNEYKEEITFEVSTAEFPEEKLIVLNIYVHIQNVSQNWVPGSLGLNSGFQILFRI